MSYIHFLPKFFCDEMDLRNDSTQLKRSFISNSFLRENQFFSCKSEHIKIPYECCSDKSNDTSDIPLVNSGLNRINHCNNTIKPDNNEHAI